MGGFYNPFARAVSYEFAPKRSEAAPAEAAASQERAEVSDGFSNRYARSVEK